MAPEAIGAVVTAALTGLTGLIVATSGWRRARNAQLREDLEACYAESQRTWARYLMALGHIGHLEEILAWHRLPVPMRPPTLDAAATNSKPSDWQPRHAAG